MRKRLLSVILVISMMIIVGGCGETPEAPIDDQAAASTEASEPDTDQSETKDDDQTDASKEKDDFHIGIVTGSISQSEDDRRGAEAFQKKYGADKVTLAIYPDNFTDEFETTVGVMTGLADDPKMKAIVVNQAVEGTDEAFRRIKEKRPDILCIAGETFDVFEEMGSVADLVVNNDFVSRGYLMIRTAHELGCDTFVHISFPRHLSYETYARRVNIMKAACDEFGMKFAIDVAFVSGEGVVVEAYRGIGAHRRLRCRAARATLERMSSEARWFEPGDFVDLKQIVKEATHEVKRRSR